MKVHERFVLLPCIPTSCTVGDGKREVEPESERLTMGSGNHKAGSGKQRMARGERKGTDGFGYHEVNHKECPQRKGMVGYGQFEVAAENGLEAQLAPLNGDLSSCRRSRENDPLPPHVPHASCKLSAGITNQNSVG